MHNRKGQLAVGFRLVASVAVISALEINSSTKHGISFPIAVSIFDGHWLEKEDTCQDYDETRLIALDGS